MVSESFHVLAEFLSKLGSESDGFLYSSGFFKTPISPNIPILSLLDITRMTLFEPAVIALAAFPITSIDSLLRMSDLSSSAKAC